MGLCLLSLQLYAHSPDTQLTSPVVPCHSCTTEYRLQLYSVTAQSKTDHWGCHVCAGAPPTDEGLQPRPHREAHRGMNIRTCPTSIDCSRSLLAPHPN